MRVTVMRVTVLCVTVMCVTVLSVTVMCDAIPLPQHELRAPPPPDRKSVV